MKRKNLIKCAARSGAFLSLSALLFTLGTGAALANKVLWSEGFETYNTDAGQIWGGLDKNLSGSPNAAPNGSGNPWFGPNPNNAWVTKATTNPLPIQEIVSPHSGQFMIRGGRGSSGWYSGWDGDADYVNIAYRFNGGNAFQNNFAVDWWFYDELGNSFPGDVNKGPGCFGDHAGLEFDPNVPTDSDYPNTGDPGGAAGRLAIGAYEEGTSGYVTSVYQVQVSGAPDAQFGDGWFNTSVTRSKGWHHAAISVNGNNVARFSIDNQVVLTHDTLSPNGFNTFTTTELQNTPDTYNQSAYYDDITLVQITGPVITSTTARGKDLVVNGKDGLTGWTYNLLMSTDLTLPLSQWTPVSTNVLSASGTFSVTATNAVSAGAPKRFFVLQAQ